MYKIFTIVSVICIVSNAFAFEYKSIEVPKSLYCERLEKDGKPLVSSAQNPFRYLHFEPRLAEILDGHVLPAWTSACAESQLDAKGLITRIENACGIGCSSPLPSEIETNKNAFVKLGRYAYQDNRFRNVCIAYCNINSSFLYGMSAGYILGQQ